MEKENDLVQKIKDSSLKDNIPILRDNTAQTIINIIKDKRYHTYLEIGTAYGYSAALVRKESGIKEVVSIEKNESNFLKAKRFLDNEDVILVNMDAFLYTPSKTYDFILIDGPKSHQELLVSKYLAFLNKDGTMFIDNIFLKKFNEKQNLTKNQKNLVDRVNAFRK
jgi:predicted O-methyltransferase YrrM